MLALLLIVVRAGIVWAWPHFCADVGSYFQAALWWEKGHWLYAAGPNGCPCTPLQQPLPSFALWVSNQLWLTWFQSDRAVIYGAVVRSACIVYDLLTFAGLVKLGVPSRMLLWGWVLNPVSLLLTGIHGNMIGHSLALTVLALAWREYWAMSALSLGVAIGLGMWPVLLAPVLAWRVKVLRYLTIAALPTLFSMLWYVYSTHEATLMLTNMLARKWVHDVGWMAAAREAWYLWSGRYSLPETIPEEWMPRAQAAFLIAYTAMLVAALRWRHPRGLAWPVLLFLVVAAGGASEFIILPLPFLLLSDNWREYTIAGFFGALAPLLLYHTGMTLTPWLHDCLYPLNEPHRNAVAALCFAATMSCWVVCARTLLREVMWQERPS